MKKIRVKFLGWSFVVMQPYPLPNIGGAKLHLKLIT